MQNIWKTLSPRRTSPQLIYEEILNSLLSLKLMDNIVITEDVLIDALWKGGHGNIRFFGEDLSLKKAQEVFVVNIFAKHVFDRGKVDVQMIQYLQPENGSDIGLMIWDNDAQDFYHDFQVKQYYRHVDDSSRTKNIDFAKLRDSITQKGAFGYEKQVVLVYLRGDLEFTKAEISEFLRDFDYVHIISRPSSVGFCDRDGVELSTEVLNVMNSDFLIFDSTNCVKVNFEPTVIN